MVRSEKRGSWARFSKCVIVVDEDVDMRNPGEVAWKALNSIDPQRDIEEEGFTRPGPDDIQMPFEVKRRANALREQAGL